MDNMITVFDTEIYKAPEQGSGKHFDKKANVFSMSCITMDILVLGHKIPKHCL